MLDWRFIWSSLAILWQITNTKPANSRRPISFAGGHIFLIFDQFCLVSVSFWQWRLAVLSDVSDLSHTGTYRFF
jgi:hypothetical protein